MPKKNTNTLTVEAILAGTALGSTQSVGHMEVIPILDEGGASDEGFAPPCFSAGTRTYSQVQARNLDPDRPTIAPMGAGFITRQAAQDHAILSASIVGPGQDKTIMNAVCVQQTQPGTIKQSEDTQMVILPASLRTRGLSLRKGGDLGRMWQHISEFHQQMGVSGGSGRGDLVLFMQHFEKELDEFVAEFELLDRQIGAVILIDGKVVGVERTPNVAFFKALWNPLIRVCYGSLAIKARKVLGNRPPATRTALSVKEKSLAGIAMALNASKVESNRRITASLDSVRGLPLLLADTAEEKQLGMELITVANTSLAGQIVLKGDRMPYVSLGASGA
jgi:hypothetical protein